MKNFYKKNEFVEIMISFLLIFLIPIVSYPNYFQTPNFQKFNRTEKYFSGIDKYFLPDGAGKKDGSSWENALAASQNSLQLELDKLSPDGTIRIGSGIYQNISLKLKTSGENGRYLKIIGRDTGAGLPVFVSNFDRHQPATTGQIFLIFQKGIRNIWIQDLKLKNYQIGIKSENGQHQNFRIINVDVNGCRECISLDGGAPAENPQIGSHDIEIKDCDFNNYTKRGVRLKNGNYQVKIINSTANAGGKDWATEPFQMGFQVVGVEGDSESASSAPDHDISFINCLAQNNYNDAGDKYWNADGFVAEKGTYNLHFINCRSFNNTDGGWDDKSVGTVYEGCIALRNKRNFRIWGEVKMFRSLGAYSIYSGGSGEDIGLWLNGKLVAENCTFHHNGVGIWVNNGASLVLKNSIISVGKARNAALSTIEPKAVFENYASVFWIENSTGEDPKFIDPGTEWDGRGPNFNSLTFGSQKGFYQN